MHVLTKIFIVLVSLLAVMLVPLVVVYAHNEDNFKARYLAADRQAEAANRKLQTEQIANRQLKSQLELEIQELTQQGQTLARERDGALAEQRELESRLALAESQQQKIRADIATLSEALNSGEQLAATLLEETRTLRGETLSAQRRAVEFDQRVRELEGQLEVAEAARRAMQEELQQIKEEHAMAMDKIALYEERVGPLGDVLADAPPLMHDLDASVLNVRRQTEQTLAEINAGSRDGVEEGWLLNIGRGATFLGRLRIIAVDINRATGVVELEDPDHRGLVQPGDRVFVRSVRMGARP